MFVAPLRTHGNTHNHEFLTFFCSCRFTELARYKTIYELFTDQSEVGALTSAGCKTTSQPAVLENVAWPRKPNKISHGHCNSIQYYELCLVYR